MSDFPGKQVRWSQSAPLALYALAAALGIASVILAAWGWRTGRRYDDQLARAAYVQAEILARDFAEEYRLRSDSAMTRVFSPLGAFDPSDANLLARLEVLVADAEACRCTPVVPLDRGLFAWTSDRPVRLETKDIAPDHVEPLRARVEAIARGYRGTGATAVVVKADREGREIVAPMLVHWGDGWARAVGYLSEPRRNAVAMFAPLARRVQRGRFGDAGDSLVMWRFIQPTGAISMELGRFESSAPGVSVAFIRPRFRTNDGDTVSSFLAPAHTQRASGPGLGAPERLDPRQHPYRLIVQVHPSAVGKLLYGTGRSPAWMVFVLLGVTLSLAVATLFIARRLVRHMQEREAFAAAIAHDLRTPLTQILLYAESVSLDRPAVRTREEAARVIVRETRRLMHLVENALHFVRLGRVRPSLRVEPLDLGSAIEETVDGLRPILERADVGADVTVEQQLTVTADAGALKQVLTNVIDNAVRFGPKGQTLVITARRESDHAVVTVDDEGPGIPERMREKVFKPFVRAGKSPGSGIGLAVSRQLMLVMGGKLSARPAPGGGARLVVMLPLAPAATTSEPALAVEVGR